jgi:hypothetical protein
LPQLSVEANKVVEGTPITRGNSLCHRSQALAQAFSLS